ncbi:aquaporin-like protein [Catenaria anguillulae PL171]|uniref:Aquaporin-like protein n=1 Tax=Catenaria anguillulae PL171 TaxID=765915 RepID=A0A1Y2I3P2_9FUNG|nr:aquaporin-like protein [Catenaria anguillulae PL171]
MSKPSSSSDIEALKHVPVSNMRRLQIKYREELAEFFGTFTLIVFGVAVVAQTVLSGGNAGSPLGIHIGWGMAVTMGIYASGGISGAHLNPAVTIALAVHSGFKWSKVPSFILAQFLGAFAAALIVYLNYMSAFTAFDGGNRTVPDLGLSAADAKIATAGIFSTYPQAYMTTAGAFFSEFFGTCMLMMGILAIGESRNSAAPKTYGPVAVGLLVLTIGVSLGVQTGYAINPARDFGPRCAAALIGYGSKVFTAFNAYFWIPIVAPVAGAVVGGYVFKALTHWDAEEAELVNGQQ